MRAIQMCPDKGLPTNLIARKIVLLFLVLCRINKSESK